MLNRYKKELQVAMDREQHMERTKAQLELDWQRRVEDVERTQYQKTEDFVRTLTTARDEVCVFVWGMGVVCTSGKSLINK